MLLRNLFEDIGPVADAAFAFGRFNPAHQGHIEVYKAVQNAGKKWYIGTNPSTQGPNDPLSFEQKSAWMQAIYPAIQGHLLPQQSVVTLASKLYEILGEGSTIAYVTDSKDWEWAGKLLNDYNGKEGPHGYYKFKAIKHVESPRVSSATALRTAARANDEAAFYAASGTDPKLTVGGKTYFETVVDAVGAHPEKVKKVAKRKEPAATEGKKPEHNLGVGWMLDKDKQLGQKVAQNKARARQERQTMLKYAGKKDLGKEQGVAEGSEDLASLRAKSNEISNRIDAIVKGGGRVGLDDPLSRQLKAIRSKIQQSKKQGVAEGEKQSKSKEMDLDWHYKNIINTKGLSDKAKKDTTDIYNQLKKDKNKKGVEEGYPLGVGRDSPSKDTLSKRTAWQKTPLNSNKIVIDGYTINFTPTALIISKGGKVLWKKDGDYSQPTNSTLAGAKKLVTGLSRQGQPDEKQMFGKTDPAELQARKEHRKKWTQASNLASEKKISFQQAWKQLFGDDLDEGNSNAMSDTAKRLANKDDGKVAKLRAAGDKRREEELKGRNIAKRNESVDLKTSLQELSNDMLGKYKKAASADASKADKEGNVKRGDKRFSGIVKATNKQFANDAKKTK